MDYATRLLLLSWIYIALLPLYFYSVFWIFVYPRLIGKIYIIITILNCLVIVVMPEMLTPFKIVNPLISLFCTYILRKE